MDAFVIRQTSQKDARFAGIICDQILQSARDRGTGIGRRDPALIEEKISSGHGIIAVHKKTDRVAGFCYLAAWDQDTLVSHCALIIFPEFRKNGLGKKIKQCAVDLSKRLYPGAPVFGLTSSLSVMKINSSLGYEPVTFGEISQDPEFWKNCRGCVHYKVLESTGRKNCFCTSMLLKAKPDIKPVVIKEEKRA